MIRCTVICQYGLQTTSKIKCDYGLKCLIAYNRKMTKERYKTLALKLYQRYFGLLARKPPEYLEKVFIREKAPILGGLYNIKVRDL